MSRLDTAAAAEEISGQFKTYRGDIYIPTVAGIWQRISNDMALFMVQAQFQTVSAAAVKQILEGVKNRSYVPEDVELPCWLDDPKHPYKPTGGLPFKDGIVDGAKNCWEIEHFFHKELHDGPDGTPKILATDTFGIKFEGPTSDNLVKFIKDATECKSASDFILAWLGRALRLDYQEFEKMLWLVGQGGTGKSTFFEAVRKILGSKCAVTSFSAMAGTFWGTRELPAHAILLTDENDSLKKMTNLERLRKLTDHVPMRAEDKFKEAYMIPFYGQVGIASNTISPSLIDRGGALERRFVMIKFRRNYGQVIDPGLKATLLADECLRGLMLAALRADRNVPYCGDSQALEELRRNDSVYAFILDGCTLGIEDTVPKGLLYSSYRDYARDGGLKTVSRREFAIRLREHLDKMGVEFSADCDHRTSYRGIGIRPEHLHSAYIS